MNKHSLTLAGVLLVSATAKSEIRLNEVHLNPPNADGLGDRNYEYIELRSTTNAVESTDGVTVLIVNNDRWDYKTNANNVEVATVLNLGEVTETWSLEDLKTGANGLLLLGDKYTELPKGGPWAGFMDPRTEVGDPLGMGDGNVRSNDGLSIFLVRNFTPPRPNAGTVEAPVVDFDVDDDGILDWREPVVPAGGYAQAPWTGQPLDQIGTRDRNSDAWPTVPIPPGVTGIAEPYTGTANGAAANINVYALTFPSTWSQDRDPDSFARNGNNITASVASAWYGGKFPDPLPGTDPANSIAFRSNRTFGLNNGQATPGRANLTASLPLADFRINEVNLDPSGDRFQFVEIANTNTPSGSRSLTDYWLVQVDSNVSSSDLGIANKVGTITEEWNLSAMATGINGLLFIADDAASSYTAFEDYVPAETGKGDPITSSSSPISSGFGAGDLGSKSGFTLFLIRGYKSGADANRPAAIDIDANDDGIIDANAFASAANAPNVTIIDSIGFDMAVPLAGGAGKSYAGAAIVTGGTAPGVNLRPVFPEFTASDGNKACDTFSRKTDASGAPVSTNVAGSWYGGEFPASAGFNLALQPPVSSQITVNNPTGVTHFGGFRGAATPGRRNLNAAINAASPPVAANIRISEVMFDPTDVAFDPEDPNNHDVDQNRDYIELLSDNRALAYLEGYWILIFDNAGNNKGVVSTGAPLDGQTTGLNGILLIGDNYDNTISIPYNSVEGQPPQTTATVDPVVAFGGDDIPGNGASIVLVRGPSYDPVTAPNGPFKSGGPIALGADLKPGGDIDPDNDGILLPSTDWLAPGSVIVDAVSIGAVNPGAEYGWINSPWLPDCAARYPTDFRPANSGAFYYGQIDQAANPSTPSTDFTSTYFGNFKGHASPGRWNHAAPVGPLEVGSILLNEVHFNPAGGDGNFEFIELLDRAGASRSLNSYSLIMIDNVLNNTGTVQRVWSLDGFMTGPNGLFVATNGTAIPSTPTSSPWIGQFRKQTIVGDPPGRDDLLTAFGDATIAAESDNQSVMLLLVRNFTSYFGADLDTLNSAQPPVAVGGDGFFDNAIAAWDAGTVHDSVVLRSWLLADPGPPPVPAQWNGFTYSLAELSGTYFPNPNALFYHPETCARFRGNLDTNSAAAWYAGDLVGGESGKLGTDTAYVTDDPTHSPMPLNFLGRVTPGQFNLAQSASGDPDGDGVPSLLEEAFGSDPSSPASTGPMPQVGIVSVTGTSYAAITYQRVKGGTTAPNDSYTAEAWIYTVETSLDMQTWTRDGSTVRPVSVTDNNPEGFTETAAFRLEASLGTPAGKAFMRVRVDRR